MRVRGRGKYKFEEGNGGKKDWKGEEVERMVGKGRVFRIGEEGKRGGGRWWEKMEGR